MTSSFARIIGWSLLGCSAALTSMAGCSSSEGSNVTGGGAVSGSGASSGASGGSGGSLDLGTEGGSNGQQPGAGGDGNDCSADFAATELQPVHLAFAFDVSGSMGKLDEPYHDPELKWRPVVAATRAFFEDTASAGLSASLTFFPAEDDKCDTETYEQPDVAMTQLPSNAFGEAIAAIDPMSADDWRGGTPTLAVVQGSFAYLTGLEEDEPDAAHALVLVTDGYPNGCDDDDIDSVADAVAESAAEFPTYVIGVKNPAGGPDTVSDLNALAVAGGTDEAIIIDTGDPDQTSDDLTAAINRIRERSVSCTASIPPTPGGRPFEPTKVNVSMRVDGESAALGYDQDCEADLAWRYDDDSNPSSIVLCPATCLSVQQTPGTELSVEFGCRTRPVIK